jgi:hypothetical protein
VLYLVKHHRKLGMATEIETIVSKIEAMLATTHRECYSLRPRSLVVRIETNACWLSTISRFNSSNC